VKALELIERILLLLLVGGCAAILADPAPVQRLHGLRYLMIVNRELVEGMGSVAPSAIA